MGLLPRTILGESRHLHSPVLAKKQNLPSASLRRIYNRWQQQHREQRLQFKVPQQKGDLSFAIETVPVIAWRYNSTLSLIYVIALLAVFGFNCWLLLTQKCTALYQVPHREISENHHILQKKVMPLISYEKKYSNRIHIKCALCTITDLQKILNSSQLLNCPPKTLKVEFLLQMFTILFLEEAFSWLNNTLSN